MPENIVRNIEDDIRAKLNRLKHMTKDIVLTDFYFYLIGNYQKFLGYVDKGIEFGGNEMFYLYAAMDGFNIIDYKNSIMTYYGNAAETIIEAREAGRLQIIKRYPELEKISQKYALGQHVDSIKNLIKKFLEAFKKNESRLEENFYLMQEIMSEESGLAHPNFWRLVNSIIGGIIGIAAGWILYSFWVGFVLGVIGVILGRISARLSRGARAQDMMTAVMNNYLKETNNFVLSHYYCFSKFEALLDRIFDKLSLADQKFYQELKKINPQADIIIHEKIDHSIKICDETLKSEVIPDKPQADNNFFQTIKEAGSDGPWIGVPKEFYSTIKPRDKVFPNDLKSVTYSEAIKCIKKHIKYIHKEAKLGSHQGITAPAQA